MDDCVRVRKGVVGFDMRDCRGLKWNLHCGTDAEAAVAFASEVFLDAIMESDLMTRVTCDV